MTTNLVPYVKKDGWKWLMTCMAIVGLTMAGAGYLSVRAKTDALEFSNALTDELTEMEDLNAAIGQIAGGESLEAQRTLQKRLSSVAADVQNQLSRADAATKSFAILVCLRAGQSELTHSPVYLSSSH